MAKANYKVLGGERLISNLKTLFESVKKSKELTGQIAQYSTERIRAQTRSGNSLPLANKFPRLSQRYQDYRKKLKKRAEAGKLRINQKVPDKDFFMPTIPNNTLTGQLMKSLFYEVSETGIITISVKGRRNDGLTNQDVALSLAEKGRQFLGMDEKGTEIIKRMVLREYRRKVKSSLKGKKALQNKIRR